MTKQELITLYYEKMDLCSKRESEKLVNGFFCLLEEILIKGEDVSIVGFGKFEVVKQASRICRNPRTGEQVQVPEKKVVKFRVGKGLAEKVEK